MKKMMTAGEARSLAEGKQAVFTNGCFDILHVGHLRYLEAARALGELLIIGVNSDRSVQSLKGPTRPIVPEEERAELLAGLACVDGVVIFEEVTAGKLIETIEPAIYAKGGDYQEDSLPETPSVRAYGGKIKILPFSEGLSTSNLIEKIRLSH